MLVDVVYGWPIIVRKEFIYLSVSMKVTVNKSFWDTDIIWHKCPIYKLRYWAPFETISASVSLYDIKTCWNFIQSSTLGRVKLPKVLVRVHLTSLSHPIFLTKKFYRVKKGKNKINYDLCLSLFSIQNFRMLLFWLKIVFPRKNRVMILSWQVSKIAKINFVLKGHY